MTRQLTDSNTSSTSLFDVYLAIFIQFFCDFHTVFLAHPINLKGLVVFLYFSKTNSYFKDDFTKFQDNSRTKGTFFQDQGQIFPGLCEPCESMSHIICHINPQIQFVDICCGHGMSLTVFIHCDLDLRSQFLKKCTQSRSPILFMVAFHIWYVDSSWTLESHQMFPGHCDLDLWFLF